MHPLTQAIIDGDKARAVDLTQQCLSEGEEPGAIIETRLVPGMAVIGEQFQQDEIFVPEMLIAANAMKASLAILEPLIAESGQRAPYRAVIGTVEGDLHDIGKNLVGMMWRGANMRSSTWASTSPLPHSRRQHASTSRTSWACQRC